MVKMGSQNVQSEDDIQGDARPLPGQYHAVVKDVKYMCKGEDKKHYEVDETDETAEKVVVTFEVLAGTIPGQAGRAIDEFFALTERAISRLQRFALCVGLLQPGEGEKEVLFSQSIGRQLVIEVEENNWEKDGRTINGVRIGYLGMWSLGNKAVADIPKDPDALKLVANMPAASSRSQGDPQEAAASSSSSSSDGGGDKWANL